MISLPTKLVLHEVRHCKGTPHMKEFRNCSQVASEIALGSFRHTFSTPRNQDILRETRVWVCHFHVGELYPSFGELLDEIGQFALCQY